MTIMLSDYSGDIMYPKVTSQLADQSQGNGVKKGRGSQFPESTKTLRGQDLYLGSLLYLGKVAPSPRFRTNLFMDYDIRTGKLKIPHDVKEKIMRLDSLLIGKEKPNSRIIEEDNEVEVEDD